MAKRAGVAVSTVSRVLNRSGYVSPGTRKKVLEAVKEMNYEPNQVARSLVGKDSKTIGLILPDIMNPFFPALARGVEDAARRYGFAVILGNTDNEAKHQEAYLRTMQQKQVDGIIITGTNVCDRMVQQLLQQGMKILLIDRPMQVEGVDLVACDNIAGALKATTCLLELGHRNISFISGPLALGPAKDRLEGYRRALHTYGIPFRNEYVAEGDFRYERGYEAMQELLTLPELPTAVFASNDLMAIGAIKAIEKAGLQVPGDISVVGYDDIMLASLFKPALTTVIQPCYRMGAAAAELLIKRITGEERGGPQQIIFTPALAIRETVGGLKQ